MPFGRDTPEDEARANAWRDYLQQRHPYAIASFVLGLISLIEFGVLIVFGLAGIALGALALLQLRRHPTPKTSPAPDRPHPTHGHRLAWAGILLSALSLLLAAFLYSLPPTS